MGRKGLVGLVTSATVAVAAFGFGTPRSAHASADGPIDTEFTWHSTTGEAVGIGGDGTLTPQDTTFQASNNGRSQVRLWLAHPQGSGYILVIDAPIGQDFVPGTTYSSVGPDGTETRSVGAMTLEWYGYYGANCTSDTRSSFTLEEIAFDSSSTLTSVGVQYSLYCAGANAPMTGVFRYARPTPVGLAVDAANVAVGTVSVLDASIPGAAGGTVTFTDGSDNVGTVPVASGHAVLAEAFGTGDHIVRATWSGVDSSQGGASQPVIVSVVPAATTTAYSWSGAPSDDISQGTSGTVTPATGSFQIKGNATWAEVVYWDSANPGGANWMTDIWAPTDQLLAPGQYANATNPTVPSDGLPFLVTSGRSRGCNGDTGDFTVTSIAFAHDGSVRSISFSFDQTCDMPSGSGILHGEWTVFQPPLTVPSISLQLHSLTQPFGTAISLVVSVRSSALGGETLTLRDGPSILASGMIANDATATLATTAPLAIGVHALTVVYGGDNQNQPSTSLPLILTVTPDPTSTGLTAATTKPLPLAPDVLTASVSSSFGNSTGSVTFYDGTRVLATRSLNSDTATFSAMFLPGSHQIGVAYNGDATHAPSVSTVLVVQCGLPI